MEIKKIKYSQDLIKTKNQLANQLKMLEKEIQDIQGECNHISVCLGYNGRYKRDNNSFYVCLLCQDNYPYSKYIKVDATYYKKEQYNHGETELYRKNRFVEIQDLAMDIIKQDPTITEEQLIITLNRIIKDNIHKENSNEKIKKLSF